MAPYSNLAYQTAGGWYQAYEPTLASTLKIYTDGNIGCNEIDVFSDRRIKTDIKNSKPKESLELIKKLQVHEFKYVDPIQYGTKTYKGLLAQEVREVVEEAVSLHNGIVPTIFQVPNFFQGKIARFHNKIEGVSIGDIIKILDEDSEKYLETLRVSDFEIEFSDELNGPRIFVYGQVVKDLHTISYDRLFPILLSAFQHLVSKVEAMTPTSSDERTS